MSGLSPPHPGQRKLAAWVGFDMALHGYALMIPAVGYALYFTSAVAAGEARASLLWSIAVAIPLVVSGLLSVRLQRAVPDDGVSRAA